MDAEIRHPRRGAVPIDEAYRRYVAAWSRFHLGPPGCRHAVEHAWDAYRTVRRLR